jgi:hypothetical protein
MTKGRPGTSATLPGLGVLASEPPPREAAWLAAGVMRCSPFALERRRSGDAQPAAAANECCAWPSTALLLSVRSHFSLDGRGIGCWACARVLGVLSRLLLSALL